MLIDAGDQRAAALDRQASEFGFFALPDKLPTSGRTSAKTVSWRTIASLDTIALAWFYTGNIATALSIGGLEVFTKMLLYFVHERVWGRLPFGIVHRPPALPPALALADR